MTTTMIDTTPTAPTTARGRASALLGRVNRPAMALLPALLAGVGLGAVVPGGPMSSGRSVVARRVAWAAGGAAGWALRSRWGAVLAPVTYAAVFEVARLGADGPAVDASRFAGMGAIAAVVAGRGF